MTMTLFIIFAAAWHLAMLAFFCWVLYLAVDNARLKAGA